MQDDDHIYNAMHSDEITDGDPSMQNRHNPPVHGPERLQNRPDNYLSNRPNDWRAQLRASGHTVTDLEPPTDRGDLKSSLRSQHFAKAAKEENDDDYKFR